MVLKSVDVLSQCKKHDRGGTWTSFDLWLGLCAPAAAPLSRGPELCNPCTPGSRTILILTDNLSQENTQKCDIY